MKRRITRKIADLKSKFFKKNKHGFFARCIKWFLFTASFIAVFVLICLAMRIAPQEIVRGKDKADSVARPAIESLEDSVQLASSGSSKIFFPNLSNGVGVYVLSKKSAICNSYQNTTHSTTFALRCKSPRAIWRGFWTKKIDVAGYDRLRIETHLGANNYTGNYFSECGGRGVGRDDVVDLVVLSSDPDPKLGAECNHAVGEDLWSHCSITNEDISAITHCGVPQCTLSTSCNMEIDVSGKNAVYMLFSVTDDWFADIEGVLSDIKIILTKYN